MNSSTRYAFFMLILALLLCLGFGILEAQTKILRITYDEIILDNRNHYLSCEQLPTDTEVKQVLDQHRDIIEKIEQIHPGFVGVEMDTSVCSGKADIIFWYGTYQERLLIEDMIAGETFYGIPYRLQNR
jgi:hypothetical protein